MSVFMEGDLVVVTREAFENGIQPGTLCRIVAINEAKRECRLLPSLPGQRVSSCAHPLGAISFAPEDGTTHRASRRTRCRGKTGRGKGEKDA